jgi:hypothetical protein
MHKKVGKEYQFMKKPKQQNTKANNNGGIGKKYLKKIQVARHEGE